MAAQGSMTMRATDSDNLTLRCARLCERQLREHPLCRYCSQWGIVTRAVACDRGDDGRTLVSLCLNCHTATKRHVELYGYRLDIGLDGYPCDRRHPAYARGR